jgi:hypothetical protein
MMSLPIRVDHAIDGTLKLKRAGHGPFEITVLICPGILGPATGRTTIGRVHR